MIVLIPSKEWSGPASRSRFYACWPGLVMGTISYFAIRIFVTPSPSASLRINAAMGLVPDLSTMVVRKPLSVYDRHLAIAA